MHVLESQTKKKRLENTVYWNKLRMIGIENVNFDSGDLYYF